MNPDKLTFEKLNDPAYRREEQFQTKTEAVWAAFVELAGLINVSKFAREYFGKSQSWFAQKLHMTPVDNKPRTFSPDECNRVASAFRDIARRLNAYADYIDKAEDQS